MSTYTSQDESTDPDEQGISTHEKRWKANHVGAYDLDESHLLDWLERHLRGWLEENKVNMTEEYMDEMKAYLYLGKQSIEAEGALDIVGERYHFWFPWKLSDVRGKHPVSKINNGLTLLSEGSQRDQSIADTAELYYQLIFIIEKSHEI